MNLIKWIKHNILKSGYEYGTCKDFVARRHRRSGEVQFVLWKAGEQGHKEDYWHRFDNSWWPGFVADKEEK